MKRNIFIIMIVTAMMAAGCGTEKADEIPDDPVIEENENNQEKIDEIENEDIENIEIEASKDEEVKVETLKFEEFEDMKFYFLSGAGGWRTELEIYDDGSFSGQFSDSEMGSTGEGYPNGTYYLCDFTGQFTEPVKVNDYTYSVQIEEINYANEPDSQEIIDEIMYYYSTPYGLDGAEEILIYLPGAPIDELPEEYMEWVRHHVQEPDAAKLPFYGLYNVTEQNGFYSYVEKIEDTISTAKLWADTIRASLENDVLNQMEMNEFAKELYAIWDNALNALWAELKEELPEDEFAKLLDEQREWIAEKEKAVKEAGKEYEGGSMYSLVVDMKAADITEERVYELYELLK